MHATTSVATEVERSKLKPPKMPAAMKSNVEPRGTAQPIHPGVPVPGPGQLLAVVQRQAKVKAQEFNDPVIHYTANGYAPDRDRAPPALTTTALTAPPAYFLPYFFCSTSALW